MESITENKKKHGVNLANLDLQANPKDDFYQFASGGWREKNKLGKEYASFGVFNLLAEQARDNVRDLICGLGNNPDSKEKGSIAQKIGDLYNMGMDTERLSKEGNRPLQPILSRIENFTRDKLSETIAWLSMGLDSTFFGFGVGPDYADSSVNVLHIFEPGLGLGDRDYYLEDNEKNRQILAAYRKYVLDLMLLSGYDEQEATRISDNVIKIETEFARHKKTREERRNPLLSNNPMDIEELESRYPNIGWKEIFKSTGLQEARKVNNTSPSFFEFLSSFLPKLSEREIKDMMAYGCVSNSAGALGESFYDVTFEMFGRVMSGTEEKKPLWKRAQGMVEALFGEAIGQLYVEKYFPAENKEYMLNLVENLRSALGTHIRELSWMSEETKIKALEKLARMKVKIGYPDKWKDYSEIDIDPGKSYMENLLNASIWFTRDNLSKLNQPVDKEEWHMTSQMVNAYYSPMMNEICFPAGILQAPFFDITAEDALNYGAIGVVIGHEMTHGFDDSGRRYDSDGNLNNWWTEDDERNFNTLTAGLVSQFDKIEVAPGVHANGTYTLGENIADQGGLRIALTAYKMAAPEHDLLSKGDDGFSNIQRFYLSYGGIWANNIRPEEILVRTQTDPHSLAKNRVNATLQNIAPFQAAFDINEGDKLYRPENEQVIIW